MLEFEARIEVDDANEILHDEKARNYKYFIGQKLCEKSNARMFLKQVEYPWRKLAINSDLANMIEMKDKWPLIDADNKQVRIDNAWLLQHECEFQFHFFNNPIQLWFGNSNKPLYINIIPWKAGSSLYELKDFAISYVVGLNYYVVKLLTVLCV